MHLSTTFCHLTVVLTLVTAAGGGAIAQDAPKPAAQTPAPAQPPANPISMSLRGFNMMVAGNIARAAEMMPEESYAFKPVDTVRSFGGIVGHVADAQYMFCAMILGEKPEPKNIEKTKTAKADLVQAVKDANAYCDKAYAGMTDAKGAEITDMFGRKLARMALLSINTAHNDEHYGNLVTYMRIKGIVPPSSEPRK